MAERLIFHYQARNTLIHRIDPRLKIVVIFTITAALFSVNAAQLAAVGGYLLAGALMARLPFQRYRRELGFFFLLLVVIFISRWIATGTFISSLYYGLRFVLVVGAGLLLTDTTAPEELTLALYWFLRPFPFLKPARTAARFNLTVSFLPLIFDAVLEIREARRARLDNIWKHPVRRVVSIGTQVFDRVLQQAEETSYALEARLFREDVVRGSIAFHRLDFLTLLVTAVFVWGIILLR